TTGSSVAAPTRRRSTRRDGAHRAHQVAPRALLAARTAPASMLHAEQVSAPFPPFSHAFPPCACMSAFPLPFRLAHAFPPSPCLSAFPMPFRLAHAFPPCACLSALRMPFRLSHAFPPCACLSPSAHAVLPAHAFSPLLMPFSLPMPFPLCSCVAPFAHALPRLLVPSVPSAMSGRWRGRESPPPSSSPTAGHDMVPLRIAGPADVATSADVACSLDRRLAMPP
ncbi:unnamed protein product, partial [Closterium sp. Naga37s-1]